MTPMRMKLRVRRRGNEATGAAGGGQPEEEEEVRREAGGRSRRKRNIGAAATAATSPVSPPSSSASARPVMSAEEASPDSKCPICLDRFNNLAYLDRCLHRFCFPCIQEWSHNKAECPLCKQPFASILHSVRAEDDFKEYTLRPTPTNSSVAATVAMVAAMASAARSNHQMRLMLRRHRGADAGEATRRERRGGGAGVWAWYVHSPPLPLPPLPPHPAVAEDGEEGGDLEEQRLRGSAGLTEYGVIFDGLREAVAPVPPNNRESRRLMTRLVERQQLQREGGGVRRLREREMVAFRRALYRCGVQVRGVAGVAHQGQQRDVTTESFRQSPAHLDRLRPWLQRELTVLYGSQGALVDIVQRIIMARIARHGLEDMPTVEEELRPFLLARTEHFLHELVSYARSPLSLESYDLQAAYEPPAAGLQLHASSSSSDSSSVIAISEGEEEEGRVGVRATARALRRTGAAHDDSAHTGSGLSLSAWDDETPGPSYSTAEPSCSLTSLAFSPAPQEPATEEGGEKQEEECLIVGYKKPIAERTPELVQLSSDPEDQDQEDQDQEDQDQEEASNKLPAPLPPLAYTPTVPPSSSRCYGNRDNQQEVGSEAGGRRSRSSSGGSGRSRNSVCSLSPPLGASEQRRQRERDREWRRSAGDGVRRRRRRRCKQSRGRGGEGLRKRGTLYNPNRSIYPPMMRSPFHSSGESGSPLTPSPTHSSWDYHCPHTSPLSSSSSSTRSSSSSPQRWYQRPPPTSVSSGDRSKDKPGGKRKYKSRHLDGNDKDPTWKPASGHRRETPRRRRRRRREEEEEEEAWAADSRRRKEERSPSVEIIYEGTVPPGATGPPAAKRCRKRQRRPQRSSPPVIITLDSDSSRDVIDASSSSPVSSQQTVDFSDLLPLPLSNTSAGGGALNAEIGELPVEILDQGSTGSDTEPAGQSRAPSAVHSWDHSPSPDLPGGGEPGHAPGPPLDRLKGVRAGEESQDVPPHLKRASPVGSYDRNTPPPLKHRDAGSPHGTSAPIGLCWPRTSADADPAASGSHAGVTISPAGLPHEATPPMKRPFTSSPEPAASTPSSDVDSYPAPPSAPQVSSVQSLSGMSPTDPVPGSKPADGLPHLDWTTSELHSGLRSTQTGSPVASVPGGSGAAGTGPSSGCWTHSDPDPSGCRSETLAWLQPPSSGPDSSCPADLHLPEKAPPSAGSPEPTVAARTGSCPADRLTGGEAAPLGAHGQGLAGGQPLPTGLKHSWDVGAQAADWSSRTARSEPDPGVGPQPEPQRADSGSKGSQRDQCIRSSSQSENQWSAQTPLIDSGTNTKP